jgi:alanine transaminase
VAEFLEERDGYVANSDNIYLTNGASDGVKLIIQMLIRENELGHNDGILCPVPQYPLFSGAVALNNGHFALLSGGGGRLGAVYCESGQGL